MKASTEKTKTKKSARATKLQHKPLPENEMPPEAQEFMRKFHEWNESFQTKAKRMAYIRKLCKRIAEAYQPEKIILFGSHAYGKPTAESDIDLLIVMDLDVRPIEQILKIRRELGIVTPVDLLVHTPKEVKRRVEEGDLFMRLIVERGKVMYET